MPGVGDQLLGFEAANAGGATGAAGAGDGAGGGGDNAASDDGAGGAGDNAASGEGASGDGHNAASGEGASGGGDNAASGDNAGGGGDNAVVREKSADSTIATFLDGRARSMERSAPDLARSGNGLATPPFSATTGSRFGTGPSAGSDGSAGAAATIVSVVSVSDSPCCGRVAPARRTRALDSSGARTAATSGARERFKIGMATHTAAPVAPPIPALRATTARTGFQRKRGRFNNATLAIKRVRTRAKAIGPGGRRFAALRKCMAAIPRADPGGCD